MSENCFKKNELFIPGIQHDKRMQEALRPSYVTPDERSVADLLQFITNYSSLINYYTIQNKGQEEYIVEGDWKNLILSDEAFNYANISITKSTLPNITFYKYITLYETGSTTAARNEAYRVLWDILFSLYKNIDKFFISIPVYMPLRQVLQTEIKNNLVSDFRQAVIAYLNADSNISVASLHTATPSTTDEYEFSYAFELLSSAFDTSWLDTETYPASNKWGEYVEILKTESSQAEEFFNIQLTNQQDKIDYSTVQLKQIFKRAFESYSRIITVASQYLQNSLDHNSTHFAHHGLLLSFIKMFGFLQQDMNAFTRKHLEYYYNRVLKIRPAPAVPDAAHIVFEVAKNVTSHLVPAQTLLNGGKDGIGKMLLYNTDYDVAISQAKIVQLKSIFLKPEDSASAVKRFYASSVANSADGSGAEFTGDDTSWSAFGNSLNDAKIGFYIASSVLHLAEGQRIIEFAFTTNDVGFAKANTLNQTLLKKYLKLSYSGEKQWEPIIFNEDGATENCSLDYVKNEGNKSFIIKLIIPLHFKPIVGYNPDVCDGGLDTLYPVVKFELIQGDSTDSAFEKLRDIKLTKISVTAQVSQMTNFSLANEWGALDSAKPVQLFGPTPKKGSSFYIGHAELAYKMLTTVSLKLNWLNLTNLAEHYKYKLDDVETNYIGIVNNDSFRVSFDLLRNKSWKLLQPDTALFNANSPTISSNLSGLSKPLYTPDSYALATTPYNPQVQNGFLRLVLKSPELAFGHSIWPQLFAQQTLAYHNDPGKNSLPNQPYLPILESLELSYSATQTILLNSTYKKEQGQFFHLMPFGTKEIEHEVELLPDMDIATKRLESAFLMGISDTAPRQNISLLIQMNEGSEDTSIDPPAVFWFYLSDDGWKELENYLVADATGNLLKSGILTFTVPNDVSKNAKELSAGETWIMAGIEKNSSGLPKMIAVYTNAVKATFTDKGNDPEHLSSPLPAGSIAKLFGADVAIKKINQPYSSFGGKKIEEGERFYTRSSERLRHKRRAITIWDYERLVINEFPDVYMTKCLNHTGYSVDCDQTSAESVMMKYKENLPGHVMLVTVPFINNMQAGNIYQPTFSSSKLASIKSFIHGLDNKNSCNEYIKSLHCGHVALHVVNPQYETIEVQCAVKIKDCLDQLAYKSQLAVDLHKFLSPWIDGDQSNIRFGGKLHASQVVYFIEQLPYIDYLENLKIIQRNGNVRLNIGDDILAIATTSRSVLTSIGDNENGIPKHNITLV